MADGFPTEVPSIDGPAVRRALDTLGFSSLRPSQAEVLGPVLAGRDTLAVLPTAAGKSALYQIPALVREGLVLVVSPLVALMVDQVRAARATGIEAHALHSHCSAVEKKKALEAVKTGKARLLFVSPERLQSLHRDDLGDRPPQLVAIDEAHCISEWGHDFRPSYRRAGGQIERLGRPQLLALTATATSQTLSEIASVLRLSDPTLIVRPPDRPNLRYGLAGGKVPISRMIGLVECPALVYGGTRRGVEEAARELRADGRRAKHYHAGMPKEERLDVQRAFLGGDVDIVCATNAFGMGIDHQGIRSVLHLEMPTSLEAYVQESGRAGRDGRPAIALCRATTDTLSVANKLSLLNWPDGRIVESFWQRLSALLDRSADPGRLQMNVTEIGRRLDVEAILTGSCLRILEEHGHIRRTAARERAVDVVLLPGRHTVTKRQAEIISALAEHADETGLVSGSSSFLRDIAGLDRRRADDLVTAGAIRISWPGDLPVIERLPESEHEPIDRARLARMRERTSKRIAACRDYVTTTKCRRAHLLDYFGTTASSPPTGVCCDRCRKKLSAVSHQPSASEGKKS